MAPSHVPSDRHPLPGQNVYPDGSYEHLFPRVSQYGAPSWDQFNQTHANLLPQTSGAPSWHQNPPPQQPYSPAPQQYGNAGHTYQSPYQYAQFNSPGPMSNYGHQPAVDPALGQDPITARQQQQSPYQQVQALRTATPQGQPTVAPQALQQSGVSLPNPRPTASSFQIPKSTTELFAQRAAPTSVAMPPVNNPKYDVPKGKVLGGYSVIDQDALAKAIQSTALNKFVNLGPTAIHLATNRTALPMYNPRQSVKDLKKTGAGNRKLLDKLAKKPSSRRILLSKSASGRLATGSPSALQRNVSDSESYSDSSDESDYTDEEDEPSPLPATRPEEPHQAVRYDIIRSTWFPRNTTLSPEKIKSSLNDLWEVLNTIQKRWRIDSKAVAEAEAQKKTGELPVLKSRVASQRDLMQTALRSTLEFGHPDVLYHVGRVKTFLYLCYQFLANRFKMQDYNGGLPTVIFEVLARSAGTLTTEVLEETKLIKALFSMKKNGNEANKVLIQQIIHGAAAGSKKPKVSTPPHDEGPDPKNAKRLAPSTGRSSVEGPVAKKLKATESASVPAKKAVSAVPPARTPTTGSAVPQKRPGEKSAVLPAKARGNQVVNKPSAFFSTLNAASKKPATATMATTVSKSATQQKTATPITKDKKPTLTAAPATKPAFSFAETMAQLLEPKKETVAAPKPEKQLPPETPEQKVKRLRKEKRKHLRVTFRPDASLVSIRYFNHDPEEESHEESFVRDAGDIGGEGRMFKQHRDMDEEDDDEEPEMTDRPFKDPTNVDFSVVDPGERERNFEPYGGGVRKPDCPEKEANQRRENSTLMIFYTDPSDIPPSPREPSESQEQQSSPAKDFGAPPQFVLDRSPKPAAPAPAAPAVDFTSLESIVRQLTSGSPSTAQPAATQSAYFPPPTPAAPTPNIAAILEALKPTSSQEAPAQIPAIPPPFPTAQPLPVFDPSALWAAIQQTSAGAVIPPVPPTWPAFPPSFPQPMQQPDQQQQSQYIQHPSGAMKRPRDEGTDGNNSANNNERGQGSFKKRRDNRNHQFTGERPHKVIPCKFFQQGKCSKGDECTFIHDRNLK